MNNDWVIVGKIGRTQGIKGWLRIYSYTDPYPSISQYCPWYIQQEESFKIVTVTDCRLQSKLLLAHFKGIDTPEAARLLTNKTIAITAAQLPPTTPGQYYWRDLESLSVYNLEQIYLGKVDHLFSNGAQDILVIVDNQKNTLLIPFVMPHLVKTVDLTAQTIIVDWSI